MLLVKKKQIIKEKSLTIYNDSRKRKGYRFITNDLRKEGFRINHKTMRTHGIKSIVRSKKYSSYKKGVIEDVCVDNILKRDFQQRE